MRLLSLLVPVSLLLLNTALAANNSAQNVSNVLKANFATSSPLKVAVAANFAKPLRAIASDFTAITGIDVSITTSSSGTLYAQISHGARFDVFLSADTARPTALANNNLIHPNNVTAYARGRLALITPFPLNENTKSSNRAVINEERGSQLLDCNSLDCLSSESPTLNMQAPSDITLGADTQTKMALERFIAETSGKFAIANPKLAPYGLAAQQVLHNTSLLDTFQERLVKGKNVLQAYQYVSSGNVKGALVAYSTVLAESNWSESLSASSSGEISDETYWFTVDEALHRPIVQSLAINDSDAALLHPNIFDARDDEQDLVVESLSHVKPASLFVQFLLSSSVQLSLYNWGYQPALGKHQAHQLQTQSARDPIYADNQMHIHEYSVNSAHSHLFKTGTYSWDM